MLIKSPIKWAGGKFYLIPKILEDFYNLNPDVFIDVFTGSAVVALNIPCDNIIANDISYPLYNFHNVIKQGLFKLEEYSLSEEEYYKNRNKFNSLKNLNTNCVELASLFYYLNKAGFNGLYRENNKGKFNVPWGKRKVVKALSIDKKHYSKIALSNTNYQNLKIVANSLLYLDPPYDTSFTKYTKRGFNWKDQQQLIKWAVNLNCPFIISNQATERIVDLYNSYDLNIEIIEAPRRISCNGNRDKAKEIYAKNF